MELLSAVWPVQGAKGNVVFFRAGLHDVAKEMLMFAGIFLHNIPIFGNTGRVETWQK